MEWTNDLVLEFIDLYRNEPIIWSPTHARHNRNEVYDAWKRIQTQFSASAHSSVTELKKKKDSLMASFRTCLYKVRQSMTNGAASNDVVKPNWFAYEKMAEFLLDKDRLKEPIRPENKTELKDERNDRLEPAVDQELPLSIELSLPAKKFKKARKCATNRIRVFTEETNRNDYSHFGAHITAKLKSYNHYVANQVEFKISQILYRADMGHFDLPRAPQDELTSEDSVSEIVALDQNVEELNSETEENLS